MTEYKKLWMFLIALAAFVMLFPSARSVRAERNAYFSSWNEDAAALNILIDYVEAVTDENSEDYIPPENRVAVFDMDGTLYGELFPTYFGYYAFVWRVLKDPDFEPDEEMLSMARDLRDYGPTNSFPEDITLRHATQEARIFGGMTLTEYYDWVNNLLLNDADGFDGMTYSEAFYQPMIEVVDYLVDNGFEVYLCSGTDRFMCRIMLEGMVDIPVNHIIGMDVALEATGQDGVDGLDYVFSRDDLIIRTDKLLVKNLKMNKVTQIVKEIGMQSVLSFGNSSGDVSMHNYTLSANPFRSAAFMLIADDDTRDYGNPEKAEALREKWEASGYNVISMKNDWQTIYGDQVRKTGTFRWAEEFSEPDRDVMYQVSLLQGLTLGDYHGSVTAGELKTHGDTGLGTFDGLNGEMIVVDGTVFRAAGDGSVEEVSDDETVPFSNVTFLDNDVYLNIDGADNFNSLISVLNEIVEERGINRFYMVRIDGTFSEMNVRSELAQEEPYQPLAKVLETDQTFFDYEDIDGTLVCLYCPPYMKDLNAAGWHLHFISADRTKGGHVLGLKLDRGKMLWDDTDGFEMSLPAGEMFSALDLTVDQSEDIEKVEKLTVTDPEGEQQ